MWQTRDLTLFGRTMLVKTLGISKLVYAASMLCVPEMVIKEARNSFFGLGVYLLKSKFRIEDKLRFL